MHEGAYGDPISIGSPFWMASQIVRHAIGVMEGDTPEAVQQKLWGSLENSGTPPNLAHRRAYLGGEIAARPVAGCMEHPAAAGAFRDPVLMNDGLRTNLQDWAYALFCIRRARLRSSSMTCNGVTCQRSR